MKSSDRMDMEYVFFFVDFAAGGYSDLLDWGRYGNAAGLGVR